MNIGIFLDGGVVQTVIADEKVNVVIVDYDVEDADEEEELHVILDNDAYAYDGSKNVEVSPEIISEVFGAIGAEMSVKEPQDEVLTFLKELQEELSTQDVDCQAAPRFWTVGDYRMTPRPEGHNDGYYINYPSEGESRPIEEDMESKKTEFSEDIEDSTEKGEELLEAISDSEVGLEDNYLDWVKEYVDEEAYLVPMAREHFVHPNTMFLTKEEAKRHIELNYYHYSSEAHTYAMTAWRALKVEKLFNILYNTDWDKYSTKQKTEQ